MRMLGSGCVDLDWGRSLSRIPMGVSDPGGVGERQPMPSWLVCPVVARHYDERRICKGRIIALSEGFRLRGRRSLRRDLAVARLRRTRAKAGQGFQGNPGLKELID